MFAVWLDLEAGDAGQDASQPDLSEGRRSGESGRAVVGKAGVFRSDTHSMLHAPHRCCCSCWFAIRLPPAEVTSRGLEVVRKIDFAPGVPADHEKFDGLRLREVINDGKIVPMA
jgi:hypothetical protein